MSRLDTSPRSPTERLLFSEIPQGRQQSHHDVALSQLKVYLPRSYPFIMVTTNSLPRHSTFFLYTSTITTVGYHDIRRNPPRQIRDPS